MFQFPIINSCHVAINKYEKDFIWLNFQILIDNPIRAIKENDLLKKKSTNFVYLNKS